MTGIYNWKWRGGEGIAVTVWYETRATERGISALVCSRSSDLPSSGRRRRIAARPHTIRHGMIAEPALRVVLKL